MPDPVVANGDGRSRLRRVPAPSARSTCSENAAELELASHRQAQAATRTTCSTKKNTTRKAPTSADPDDTLTDYDSDSGLGSPAPQKWLVKGKARDIPDSLSRSEDTRTFSQGHPDTQQDISFEPTETGADGLLQDIKVIDLDETEDPVKRRGRSGERPMGLPLEGLGPSPTQGAGICLVGESGMRKRGENAP
ncbi:hypothetical protein EDD15DRAFT_2197703 [Pisolithus albus]|nr:hypothetical protein EDD15DRAFT_2197703 [Pisolithus albus]